MKNVSAAKNVVRTVHADPLQFGKVVIVPHCGRLGIDDGSIMMAKKSGEKPDIALIDAMNCQVALFFVSPKNTDFEIVLRVNENPCQTG